MTLFTFFMEKKKFFYLNLLECQARKVSVQKYSGPEIVNKNLKGEQN